MDAMARKHPTANDLDGLLTGIEPIGKHESMAEAVYIVLKDAIANGILKSGQRLVEQKLSDRMQVSRVPVREAIKRLEQDRFVQKLPTRGTVVRKVSEEDIGEAYEVRAILEGYAASRLIGRKNSKLITSLENNIQASLKALRKGDVKEVADLDDQFHHMIYKAMKSEMPAMLIRISMDYTARYHRRLLNFIQYGRACVNGHRAIVEAIREGNKTNAETIMRSHILLNKRLILEHRPDSRADLRTKARNPGTDRGETGNSVHHLKMRKRLTEK